MILVAAPVDIRPWLWKAAVFISPIIEGGDTRLKILDALAMGQGVFSTMIGTKGLNVKSGEHLLVADAPEDFADQVLRLRDDPGPWRKLAAGGRELVESVYGWKVICAHLEGAYSRHLEGTDD